MSDSMTKTERKELATVVKQQFRVLRSELEQRHQELLEGGREEIAERFTDEERRREAVRDRVAEIIEAARREATDVLKDEGVGVTIQRPYDIRGERIVWPETGKRTLNQDLATALEGRVKQAKLRLERQEADLLRKLAAGALESDDARTFFDAIPTVGELVPAARLAELMPALDDGDER